MFIYAPLITLFTMNVPQQAVILAGGKGTRLAPLTHTIPKSLIQINEKTITENLFDLLKKYNVNNVILSVGHMKEKIKDYFGDGSNFDIKITYIEEDEPLGTAGALRLGKKKLKETFIVSNGDELKNINIEEMYSSHKENKAMATIALTTVQDPSQYGVAKMQENKILEFIEKPKNPVSNLINAGFYIIEPDVLSLIPEGFAMLEKDVFPLLAEQQKLYGYVFSGQWFDTGSVERLEKAKKLWRGVD